MDVQCSEDRVVTAPSPPSPVHIETLPESDICCLLCSRSPYFQRGLGGQKPGERGKRETQVWPRTVEISSIWEITRLDNG